MELVVAAAYSWLGFVRSPTAIYAAVACALVALVHLRWSQNVHLTSHIGTAALYVGVMSASLDVGGLHASALAWWMTVPVTAGFLSGRRGLLLWGVVSWISILGLAYGHLHGWVPPPPTGAAFYIQSVVALVSALLTVGMLVAGFLSENAAYHQSLRASVEALQEEIRFRRDAEDAAREALAARERFLAMMSHELRTPLNGLLGPNQLLSETELQEAQRELVAIALKSARSLGDLLDDILDYSNLDAGKLELDSHTFSLRELVEQAAARVRDRAQRKGVEVHVRVDSAIPKRVYGDASRVRQVLTHLLGNAEKFTHTGAIWLELDWLAEGVRFCVTDTGIGMEENQSQRLFDAFVQGESGETRTYGGSGLGLPICHNLVQLMGGVLVVESTVGEGSRFHFVVRLPEASTRRRPRSQPRDTGSFPLRILIAEDNPVSTRVATRLLEEGKHSVVAVANGEEAVEAARTHTFDLILMDVLMPVMDGMEATRLIREGEPVGRRVPIVALTASASQKDREACLHVGMDDFIIKPIDLATFRERLAHWQGVTQRERVLTW